MRDFSQNSIDLNGKGILVTGGTGSFGRRFIRTVLDRFDPKRVVIYSRDELKQFEMEQELPVSKHRSLRYFIGDVRDRDRLRMAMRGIDIVIHAAALKHVPAAEYNPTECIHTNVIGAENIIHAAIESGVEKVLALSTDKAANPINLYGASKLAADKLFIAGNSLSATEGTRFAVVRYGNVVGSRGSVVPLFKKLVANGETELPITDERMTRFWITLQQGVDFVLSSIGPMGGGEIFVPKIPSMKIIDLARCMAPSRKHEIVGIRPGEKLHEVMITEDDGRATRELPDRYVIEPQSLMLEDVSKLWMEFPRVEEGFRYASDNNPEWLDEKAMTKLLDEV